MTYELLRDKMMNGTPFTKAQGRRYIDTLGLDVSPEQRSELEALNEKHGLDFLPEDGEARLTNLENRMDETDLIVADIVLGGDGV